ncbi:hypothetical protein SCP_0803130 [Sparassis crispa]|uniref:Uncharacterized protein n=1 Tax=Sparassis crispa TaxID=139825 RepID=A0A401GU87_9APHY|nr:hypothetical protein SCP_0803130 [Sparassis crispa]GBE85791.1 hypothetical protein SCP_0803130 [Sparassis crispa]
MYNGRVLGAIAPKPVARGVPDAAYILHYSRGSSHSGPARARLGPDHFGNLPMAA